MDSKNLARGAGVLTLGAVALNIYIGLYDKNLSTYQPLHWDLNWVLVVAGLVAAAFLIGFPRNTWLVLLGGVVWPILYVLFLGVDVYTRLCLGGNQANCWPSKTAAFNYLILNNPNITGGYGWKLWQGTMPLALAFLAIAFVLAVISLYSLRKAAWRRMPSSRPITPTGQPQPGQTPPGQTPPASGQQNPPKP
jgi:hypothetical protein